MTKAKVIVQSKKDYRISRTFRAMVKPTAVQSGTVGMRNMIMGELVPTVHQKSHHELLSSEQLEEAKKMGIKGLTSKNTQYDLLKLVKFQKDRARVTNKETKHLLKQHGRKRTKLILQKKLNSQPN